MKKCGVCGGTLKHLKEDQYKCEFCGNLISGQEDSDESIGNVNTQQRGVDVYNNNINGILEIHGSGKGKQWSGSGYLISIEGYAITNAHVAADDDGEPCEKMKVRICKEEIDAKVVLLADDKAGHGEGVDLAIIKLNQVPESAQALSLGDFKNVRNGEKVYVIGNSLGDGTCITSGIVSDKRRIVAGKELLMTDCPINGGNSGGPIFNERGLVIGTICSHRVKEDGSAVAGMNYAIPVDLVRDFINKAKQLMVENL